MYRSVREIHIQFPRLDPPKNRSGRLTANQAMKQFISWVCYLVSTGLGRRELNARVADSSVARLETGLRGSLWIELMVGDTAVNRRRGREESPREWRAEMFQRYISVGKNFNCRIIDKSLSSLHIYFLLNLGDIQFKQYWILCKFDIKSISRIDKKSF